MDLIANSSRRTSLMVGAFIALVIVVGYSLVGIGTFINVAAPYVAGTGMFVALLSIFGVIIATLKKVKKSARKQLAMMDCYIAVAIIGVAGYFLAACVQTFQPGGNPADLWVLGAGSAAVFAALFSSGSFLSSMYAAGGKAN